jgi:hypothetical protein
MQGPLVAVLLGISMTSALAGGAVDVTAEDVAVAALLQAGDVHESATSEGYTVADGGDLAGYSENGGLREVRQTWSSEGPASIVFDFRWQFPDADAAATFLDAAEEVLSEVSTGAEQQSLPRRRRPLPDTRFYTFEDTIFGTGTVGFNFLMRLENLVAKVYVSGDGEQLAQPEALRIARAAADRMRAALEGAPPVASPRPVETPTPTDSGASPSPSPSGDASPVPSAGGQQATDELLSHVPSAMRDTCAPDTGTDQEPPPAEQLARVVCPTTSGGVVTFVLFNTVEAMDAAYDAAQQYARAFGSFTTAGTCEGGGYDGTWSLGDVEAGRLLCHELQGEASIAWSHPATRILSLIQQDAGDHAAAWELWLAAGPE